MDSARHPGTGGGPPPESPSAAEEIILAATGSRPGMMGIPSGIDTDAVLPICPERGVCSADSLNEIQAALPSTNGSGNTTFTVSCSDVPSCSDAPNVATCSTTVTVTDEPISGKRLSTSHCDGMIVSKLMRGLRQNILQNVVFSSSTRTILKLN